jgi:Tfp pilus assembly PilM family ATPase
MKSAAKSKRWRLEIGLDETVEVVRMAGVHPQFQFKVVHWEHDARKPEIMNERKVGHAPTLARAFKLARTHVQRVRGW